MPYRRRRRAMRSTGNVIQSFKKVLNYAPASRAAAVKLDAPLVIGVDSIAAGQTSATDADVPTGSVVKFIEIQYATTNLVAIASHMHISIQHLRSGQSTIVPNAIGGNPQRNQVHFQMLYSMGKEQNQNKVLRFKIPKKFQRVREGDQWMFTRIPDTIITDATQVVYKFYR